MGGNKAKRNQRRGRSFNRRYEFIQQEDKEKFLDLVLARAKGIFEASSLVGIKYNTAKTILHNYRCQVKKFYEFHKQQIDQAKQRRCSFRVISSDNPSKEFQIESKMGRQVFDDFTFQLGELTNQKGDKSLQESHETLKTD